MPHVDPERPRDTQPVERAMLKKSFIFHGQDRARDVGRQIRHPHLSSRRFGLRGPFRQDLRLQTPTGQRHMAGQRVKGGQSAAAEFHPQKLGRIILVRIAEGAEKTINSGSSAE